MISNFPVSLVQKLKTGFFDPLLEDCESQEARVSIVVHYLDALVGE